MLLLQHAGLMMLCFEDDVLAVHLHVHIKSRAGVGPQHPTRIRIAALYRIGREEKWCVEIKQVKAPQPEG